MKQVPLKLSVPDSAVENHPVLENIETLFATPISELDNQEPKQ